MEKSKKHSKLDFFLQMTVSIPLISRMLDTFLMSHRLRNNAISSLAKTITLSLNLCLHLYVHHLQATVGLIIR